MGTLARMNRLVLACPFSIIPWALCVGIRYSCESLLVESKIVNIDFKGGDEWLSVMNYTS